MSDIFSQRERFAASGQWRAAEAPTHRYRIRELSETDTEWLVCEVYGFLPTTWRLGWETRSINGKLWSLADAACGCVDGVFSGLTRWERAEIVFKAYRHLRHTGVIEIQRDPRIKYIRHPLPPDPLLKPSSSLCVHAAASLVSHAVPVSDTHVSVPQQMMRGLLSGALVR